jgi:hypothetical protein
MNPIPPEGLVTLIACVIMMFSTFLPLLSTASNPTQSHALFTPLAQISEFGQQDHYP